MSLFGNGGNRLRGASLPTGQGKWNSDIAPRGKRQRKGLCTRGQFGPLPSVASPRSFTFAPFFPPPLPVPCHLAFLPLAPPPCCPNVRKCEAKDRHCPRGFWRELKSCCTNRSPRQMASVVATLGWGRQGTRLSDALVGPYMSCCPYRPRSPGPLLFFNYYRCLGVPGADTAKADGSCSTGSNLSNAET